MARDEVFSMKVDGAERALLATAAAREDTSSSAVARRGALAEARRILSWDEVAERIQAAWGV